ncbi:MAG: type I restriction enzyme HsdR N-terminal domain-containing protein [Parachlamydiaceae bacterium]|nr:MAG: type I restriction enzyme HsdR N-terminal domain-containing protein [Parachlamydiaceae bacterium]
MVERQLYCFNRKIWVAATPEEYVRQEILQLMLQLGYPSSYIAVEKDLAALSYAPKTLSFPDRRADIVCYTKQPSKGLRPLLIVECKAIPLTQKEISQVIGYNYLIKAAFIALVNQKERRLGWYDPSLSDYKFIDYIPSYTQLINSLN